MITNSMRSSDILDRETIKAAESVLKKGYCVELRPVKDGVKVIQVIRQQVTEKQNKVPSP